VLYLCIFPQSKHAGVHAYGMMPMSHSMLIATYVQQCRGLSNNVCPNRECSALHTCTSSYILRICPPTHIQQGPPAANLITKGKPYLMSAAMSGTVRFSPLIIRLWSILNPPNWPNVLIMSNNQPYKWKHTIQCIIISRVAHYTSLITWAMLICVQYSCMSANK
jgi:hypothetical protein